jgi:hypothetical protein
MVERKTRGCEICKKTIESERLESLPDTRLCSAHAEQIQKYGGEFLVTGTQRSLSKEGSFKSNPGDVTVQKRRNQVALDRLRDEYLLNAEE